MREVQQPRRARGCLECDDVGDRPERRPLPKREPNLDRLAIAPLAFRRDMERPIESENSAMKEDPPWNRCC
jgi:hypothetical protein